MTCIASVWIPANSDTGKTQDAKKKPLDNPYEDNTDKAAANIVNAALGAVGKGVVITIKSNGGKEEKFYTKIPGDKYSPQGDETAKAVLAATSSLNAAVETAKQKGLSSTINISVEVLPDPRTLENNSVLIKKKNLDVEKIMDGKRKQVLDRLMKK